MKNIYIIPIVMLFIASYSNSYAQGCVAIRGFSGCGGGQGANLKTGDISLGTNFRYFKSFRHFRGNHEETNRLEEGTEVINNSYFLDLTINYGITDRIFASAIIPFVYHERSSMYEHGGNPPNGLGERHTTYSQGLADIRLSAGYWLFDPETSHKSNLALSLGFKLPSGKPGATGMFYNQGPERSEDRVAVLDQSIQPGDGGFGYSLELQGFHMFSEKLLITGNFFYLLNPQATNDVLRRNGDPGDINDKFSVPDQYAIRFGVNYLFTSKGLSLYLGPRMEAIPSSDLIGGSEGYRRPGYAISIEPGISYSHKNITTSLNVPVAVERNRTKSYSDKLNGRHGDAAFADYLINFSFNYRINKKAKTDYKFETAE